VVGIDEQLPDTMLPAEVDVVLKKSFPVEFDKRLGYRLRQ
jgi:hypothetical protein